jgi:antitoxin ParD1/3/4
MCCAMQQSHCTCSLMGIDLGSNICYQCAMSKTEKISIALTPALNKMVQDAVESGRYATSSEVVRDALRGWGQYETARAEATIRMREIIQVGLESGPGQLASIDSIISEAKKRRKVLMKKSA